MGGSCGKGGNPLNILNKLISQKFFIKNDLFLRALRKWYPEELEDNVCQNLLLRLDEYKILVVNVTALDAFVGTDNFHEKIKNYRETLLSQAVSDDSTPLDLSSFSDLTLDSSSPSVERLLIWIDDNPMNNELHVAEAKNLGITVLELQSTAQAKVWVDKNLGKILPWNI